MQQLPKLVHARLNKRQPAIHPEADQLTAFAENALSKQERSEVLEHLAACVECREVLSVAQVQLPDAQVETRSKHARFRSPVLRWATAAMLAVVAGSTALVTMHRKSAGPAPAAKLEINAPLSRSDHLESSVAAREKQLDELAKAESKAVTLSKSSPPRKQPLQVNKIYAVKAKPPVAPGEKREGSKPESSLDLMATTRDNFPPTPPLPQAMDRDTVSSQSEALESRSENVAVAAAAPAPVAASTAEVSKAKKPVSNIVAEKDSTVTGGSRNYIAGLQKAPASRSMLPVANALPRWTISADGALERSFDSGKTWQKVVVPGNAIFRAVSSVGPDVWAGGSAGWLYHSPDAGQQWIRVQPTAAGATLNSDVTSVEFTDAQHGKLTTADHEIWTTSDAGQSWQVLRP